MQIEIAQTVIVASKMDNILMNRMAKHNISSTAAI